MMRDGKSEELTTVYIGILEVTERILDNSNIFLHFRIGISKMKGGLETMMNREGKAGTAWVKPHPDCRCDSRKAIVLDRANQMSNLGRKAKDGERLAGIDLSCGLAI